MENEAPRSRGVGRNRSCCTRLCRERRPPSAASLRSAKHRQRTSTFTHPPPFLSPLSPPLVSRYSLPQRIPPHNPPPPASYTASDGDVRGGHAVAPSRGTPPAAAPPSRGRRAARAARLAMRGWQYRWGGWWGWWGWCRWWWRQVVLAARPPLRARAPRTPSRRARKKDSDARPYRPRRQPCERWLHPNHRRPAPSTLSSHAHTHRGLCIRRSPQDERAGAGPTSHPPLPSVSPASRTVTTRSSCSHPWRAADLRS